MIHDLRSLPAGLELETDFCVIGAGPVGISVARELAGGRAHVLVLERGGLDPENTPQDRHATCTTGLPYDLAGSHEFAVGGTAHAWDVKLSTGESGALLLPFDRWDFHPRKWVSYSGWPFDLEVLVPYYERAYELCGIRPSWYGSELLCKGRTACLPLPPTRVRTIPKFVVARGRFTYPEMGGLRQIQGVDLWHNAHVKELVTDPSGGQIIHAFATRPDGSNVRVRARTFVLAGGGIENPRLLLASGGDAGIGNGNDLVGRFFMEHPTGATAVLVPDPGISDTLSSTYMLNEGQNGAMRYYLALGEISLRNDNILGYHAVMWRTEPEWLPDELQDLALRAQQALGFRVPLFAMTFMSEQAPNPDSRVTITRDLAGNTSVSLNWRLTPLDYRTMVRGQQAIQEEIHLQRLGTMLTKPYTDESGGFKTRMWRGSTYSIAGAHHHMGTTRMHSDPQQGVVDANCRLHGVSNLYIAGTSLFPTSSHVNPTLTALALGIRLAEHLRSE